VRLTVWHAARQAPGSPDAAGSGPLVPAAPPRTGAEPNPALAVALARYLAVADQLAALLAWYTKPPRAPTPWSGDEPARMPWRHWANSPAP